MKFFFTFIVLFINLISGFSQTVTYNWNSFTAGGTSYSNTQNGGCTMSSTVSGSNFNGTSPRFDNAVGTNGAGLFLDHNWTNINNETVVTSNFSPALTNPSFTLYDINRNPTTSDFCSNAWTDSVYVTAVGATSVSVSQSDPIQQNIQIVGTSVGILANAVCNQTTQGSVTISFVGPVTQITIRYLSGRIVTRCSTFSPCGVGTAPTCATPVNCSDPGRQFITIGNITGTSCCAVTSPPSSITGNVGPFCGPTTTTLTGVGTASNSQWHTGSCSGPIIGTGTSITVTPSTTTTYYVNNLDCNNNPTTCVQITVTVNNPTTPTFAPISPICSGGTLAALPTTSTNGITGAWSPALNNTATTTYTFTPNSGQCATTTTLTVTVNNPATPTFTAVSPICSGSTLAALPTTSTNGITGAWSPALNNTATTTYTFTPSSGQCATTTTMTVTVNNPTTPTFTAVTPICVGESLSPLPSTSTNGITGTWSPALNNTTTTTYTFTPNTGQCANTTSLTITVNTPSITPTFTQVAPICSGDALSPLPTSSNNGITGTWSPALNNTATTTYTFTPNTGQCSNTATMTITINPPSITPTFTQVSPICSGSTLSSLPTTSTNGITGAWSPALNNTSTTTYTFTPNGGQCANTTNMTITVNNLSTPTFASVSPICSGSTLSPLPASSTNGITGAWSPALNNTATTTYTFTPNTGQCANTTTMTITVNNPTTPTFNAVAPICSGETLSPLPTTSTNSITGAWSPALNNTSTTTYTFTPNTGQCANTSTMTITVNNPITPTFTQVSPICSGTTLSPLPTTSTNGISGVWSPALNNTSTTTYTFTPNGGQCANTTTMTITVNNPITPTFTQVSPICSGSTLSSLPTTSTNGISGVWSPALNNAATTNYTFTPNTGQCANTTTMTITINPISTPTFTAVSPICSGETLSPLPTTSINGITGTWSPVLNNTITTTYTFTPSSGQCANTTTLSITVNPILTPTFTQVNPICSGSTLSSLPTTSSNGITGAWSPALNNITTTTYTFTPNTGQCANTTTMTITVNNPITPTFTQVAPICSGTTLSPLPTTSTNGITGTWSPALNNTSTTTYTFTPNGGQCANTTSMTITVNNATTPTFTQVSPICSGDALIPLPTTSNNGITGAWSPVLNNTATTTYSFTPNTGQCGVGTTLTIVVNPNPTLVITNPQPVCNPNTIDITNTSVTTGSSAGSFSYWTNPSGTNPLTNPASISTSATYYIQLTSASGCKTIQPVTVIINNTPVLSITDPNPVCSPSTVNLTSPSITSGSSSGVTLTYWQNAGATISLGSPQSISSSGIYYIQSTSGAGCSVLEAVNVSILQPPTPIISADNLAGCSPVCVNFSDLTTDNISTWNWTLGNEGNSSDPNPSQCFTSVGQQNITLTATGTNGCSATSAPITITVYPTPIADFSASSYTISMIDGDSIVSFYNQSTPDVVSWYWDFGTGETLSPNQPNPTYGYPFTNGGNYTTTLTVYNSFGCSDVITKEIIVEPYFTFYIPNVFSPDFDGKNDTFFGVGIGIVDYEITIFDRWGEKIFESNNIEKGWDGKANGGAEIAQQDVYVWKVNLKDIFNKKHEYIGRVSLIK